MTFQVSLSNGTNLRLIALNDVLFAVLNAERNKRDTDLLRARHLG
jgi:hypothetical protein